jgi:uncharacterized membrane protein
MQSRALGISADGSILVGSISVNSMANPKAAKWVNSVPSLLPTLNANAISAALAITPDGSTIVGQSAGRAVRWVGAGIQDLGLIPGGAAATLYYGSAVSADGSIVVGLGNFNAGQGTGTAIIWDAAHGMRDLNLVLANDYGLNLQGFQCFWARAISADGKVIAGYGFSSIGQEAFIADLHSGPAECYPNCDGSTVTPVLNVNDFTCFLNRYASGDSYANCDGSTAMPVLNVNDFTCFLNRFAAGCP